MPARVDRWLVPIDERRPDAGEHAVALSWGSYAAFVGKIFDGIDDALASWVSAQPMWFVATAPMAADGHVNVSPRGHDSFSVLGRYRVGWVDYSGSGVETIAHGSYDYTGAGSCACRASLISKRLRSGTRRIRARARWWS